VLSDLSLDVGLRERSVRRWLPAPRDDGYLSRIRATLVPEVALESNALEVSVTEKCGTVEVGVTGPRAELRLLFDRAHLDPAYVRHVVRRTVKRYRASLGHRPYSKGHSGRE
jgi:hypothetical protein